MTAHPYMANSAPELRAGAARRRRRRDVEELFAQIPADHRLQRRARAAAGARRPRRAAAAPASTCSRANETCERQPQLPRRRHLAAPRARGLRRDRPAQRVPHAGLGHAVLRPRPQPGVVRVREPARRAARHGLRRPARLQLGLRRPATRSAWRRASPAAHRCSFPRAIDPERLAVIRTYCEPPETRTARSRSSSSTTTPRPGGSTSTTCGRSSRRAPPPSTSRTPATSA